MKWPPIKDSQKTQSLKNRITFAEIFRAKRGQRLYKMLWSCWNHEFYCQAIKWEKFSAANSYYLSWKWKDDSTRVDTSSQRAEPRAMESCSQTFRHSQGTLHFDNRILYNYKDLTRTLHQLWHCPRYFLGFSFLAFYNNLLAHQNSVYFFPLQRPIIGFRINSSVWPVENNVPLMIFKHS